MYGREGALVDEANAVRIALGDRSAFEAVYQRYGSTVRALARRMVGAADADDVLQEVFSTLWEKAGQFDPARGRFEPWFMTIARRHCIQVLRRRGRLAQVAASDALEMMLLGRPDGAPGPEQTAAFHEQSQLLRHALGTLPDEQRRVLLLAYFGGMSQPEIAVATGSPLGTVKRRVQLGMQKLRVALSGESALGPIEVISAERWA